MDPTKLRIYRLAPFFEAICMKRKRHEAYENSFIWQKIATNNLQTLFGAST